MGGGPGVLAEMILLVVLLLVGCAPAHPEWGTVAIYREGKLAECWADGHYFRPTQGRCDLGGYASD